MICIYQTQNFFQYASAQVEYIMWYYFLMWDAIHAIPIEYLSDVQLNLLLLGRQTGSMTDIGWKDSSYGYVMIALCVWHSIGVELHKTKQNNVIFLDEKYFNFCAYLNSTS